MPVTPAEIARASLEAARAGASIVHVHVREPGNKQGSRELSYYREVVDRIRSDATDVVINLTTGMGSTWVVNDSELHSPGPGSDFVSPEERVSHILELRPEVCSLDCGTMNFGAGDVIEINTPNHVRTAARLIKDAGVKAELEVFDLGQLMLANRLVSEQLVLGAPLYQFCQGIPGGAPATTGTLLNFLSLLPENVHWSAFGISRMQMPMVAQSLLLGGHCRVGLEDNLYLSRGVFASNAELVEKAKVIIENLGAGILTPAETRQMLGLSNRGSLVPAPP
jgi:uncharacterized protein (DUF849 family)